MFSYRTMEERIDARHPIRKIRGLVDRALQGIEPQLEAAYSRIGRPSIAPEKLLRASLLQLLYSVRSERRLMEWMDHDLLFRWFVGLEMDDEVWDPTVFTKNRERLLGATVVTALFEQLLAQARQAQLLSEDHFTVDGTLIQAWASKKSYQEKSDPPAPGQGSGRDGECLKRDRYESRTEPEARMYKKSGGAEAKLSYLGHSLIENRHGLLVAARVTLAGTDQEREAALEMLAGVRGVGRRRITLGADKAYDEEKFVRQLRQRKVTPHIAQYTGERSSALDQRTTRHAGYRISQARRKWVERTFGWMKTVALMGRARLRGLKLVANAFTLAALAYNLVRLRKLLPEAA